MASIKIEGVTVILSENERRITGIGAVIKKMLKTGADIIIKSQQEHLDAAVLGYTPKEPVRRTGELSRSIKAGQVTATRDEAKIEVWPQGERTDKWHKKPARNAEIGFVTNYGRSGVRARPFIQQAVDATDETIKRRWEEMLNEYMANG